MRLLSPIGGYLLKPPAQKAATKHWLKLEVISAHHVPKVGEGRVQHDAAPWYQHAPVLNTKSAAPNARAPDDLYLVATLLGGGADACLLGARPAAASKDEAAVDEAAALGQGQRRLQSKAVSSNGLPNTNRKQQPPSRPKVRRSAVPSPRLPQDAQAEAKERAEAFSDPSRRINQAVRDASLPLRTELLRTRLPAADQHVKVQSGQ